jgi:hypothetical protein
MDALLLDGVTEVELWPSDWHWWECRGRRVVTLITDPPGGGAPVAGLPAIQNQRREIVGFQSVIKSSVAAEYAPASSTSASGSARPLPSTPPPRPP